MLAGGKDSKSDKVYRLVEKGLKLPIWDRVQKNRVLNVSFDLFLNRVPCGGAGPDPIALLATSEGTRRDHEKFEMWKVHSRPNLELATPTHSRKKFGS